MSEVEEWRPVVGADGYEVSNLGRVRSYRHLKFASTRAPLILRSELHHGYERVLLRPSRRHAWVHRLVLEAFVGPCPPGHECRHFPDPDRRNNRLVNLQWGTSQENHDDMRVHGTRAQGSRHGTHTKPGTVRRGGTNGNAKLCDSDIPRIRSLLAQRVPMYKIGRLYGVSKPTIARIRDGLTWAHITTTG